MSVAPGGKGKGREREREGTGAPGEGAQEGEGEVEPEPEDEELVYSDDEVRVVRCCSVRAVKLTFAPRLPSSA